MVEPGLDVAERETHATELHFLHGGGEMGARMRAFDWAASELGPAENWPVSLKTAVSMCLNARFPILLWWGPRLIKLYNDEYSTLLGSKHPGALGAAGETVWPEIWSTIGPMLAGVTDPGEAVRAENLYLALERKGYAEECYFTFSYSPIRDESGRIVGVFTPVVETTEQLVATRRLKTLRALEAVAGSSMGDEAAVCEAMMRLCAGNPWDLPLVRTYLYERPLRPGVGAGQPQDQPPTAILVASSEDEAGAGSAAVTSASGARRWSQHLGPDAVAVKQVDLTPAEIASATRSAWGGPLAHAVIIPLLCAGETAPVGFVVAGVSPQRPLDDAYREFHEQVGLVLSRALAVVRANRREIEARDAVEEERARLRRLFEAAPAAIAVLNGPDHQITFANEMYVRVVQRNSAAELLGKPLREALPELQGQPFLGWLDEVYKTGESKTGVEVPATVGRPGAEATSPVYFNFVNQATRNASGAIDGILVYALDVTPQVTARYKAEQREDEFRVLADSIPQLAWMTEPDGYIIWYNQRWYEYTGKTPAEMMGWGWQSVHPAETVQSVLANFRNSLTSGEPFEMTFPLIGADGKARMFLTRAVPMRDAAGTILRWFGTNTDIETQRKTEDALRQSEKLAAVGRLASSIAHEINNPLESVTNLLYLARLQAETPVVQEYLDLAEQELRRVSHIASQTLRFHKQATKAKAVGCGDLFATVLSIYEGRLKNSKIVVEKRKRARQPVVCFEGEVRQVLNNLVGNALDAMPEGGRLILRSREATDWKSGRKGLTLTVADTGTGMDVDTRARIFEAFFTTKGFGGTGLGLWISSEIVARHQGRLSVRSSQREARRGTVVTLFLPFSAAEAPAVV